MRKGILLLLFVIIFTPIFAQVTTSTIVGKITNSKGEVTVAATLELINEKNGFHYRTQSNSKGLYRIPNIAPGKNYNLIVTHKSTKENRVNNITLYIGETYTINIVVSETDTITKPKRVKRGLTAEDIKLIPTIERNDIIRIFPQLTNQEVTIKENVDQLAVLERFDVRDNDISVNTLNKSGANRFSATAYTYLSNEFKSKIIGASLSGAIVKNKLLYYVNADVERDNNNKTFDFSNYKYTSYDDILALVSKTASYNMGSYTENGNQNNSTNIFARLDWNANERNKITITNNTISDNELKGDGSSNESIFFANSLTKSTSKINSTTFEVLSNSSPASSNRFFITANFTNHYNGYRGEPYPSVIIAKERITLGSNTENSSIKESQFILEDNIEINKGKHTVTIGTHNEFQNLKYNDNPNSFGSYYFETLFDFVNGNRSPYYTQTYYTNSEVKLKRFLLSFYVQDIIRIKSNFTLTYGLRLESHITLNKPQTNNEFNKESAPLLNSTVTGNKVSPTLQLLPRVSFDWMISNNIQLNGGIGLFSNQTHYRDIISSYTNNGMLYENIMCNTGIDFSTNFNDRYPTDSPTDIRLQPYDINLIDKKLKSPKHIKARIEAQYITTSNFVISLVGSYSKIIQDIKNENLRLMETDKTVTGSVGDNRPIYHYNYNDNLNSYNDILYTTNRSKGDSYNLILSLYKDFHFGLSAFVAYNYNNKSNLRAIFCYKLDYTNTVFSLSYDGRHRSSYSLKSDNQLLYIPLDENDINLIDKIDQTLYSKEQQWEDLNNMINNNSYLRNNRGTISKENSIHSPWENIIDFKITQNITIAKNHKIELSFDAINISGSKMYRLNTKNYEILNLEGYESDGTTPRYTVNQENIKNKNEIIFTENWKFQLGIRYVF